MTAYFPFPEPMLIKSTLEYAARIDTLTCLAVCLTCKDLWGQSSEGRRTGGLEIGRRILYGNVKIRRPNHFEDDGDSSGAMTEDIEKWDSLCRTLLNNRDLASYVHSLDVCFDSYYLDHGPPQFGEAVFFRDLMNNKLSLAPTQRASMDRWFDDYCGSPLDEDDDALDFGLWEYLSVAMMACPNLTSLSISKVFLDLEIVGELAQELQRDSQTNEVSTASSTYGLLSLQELTITEDPIRSDLSEDIDPLFVHKVLSWWPGLKKLTISNLHDELYLGYENMLHPSSLQELHMGIKTDWVQNGFYCLFGRCPQLKTMTLILDDQCDLWTVIEWRRLSDTLLSSNTMLEELRIDIPHRSFPSELPIITSSYFCKEPVRLAGLPHLRKVAVPKLILLGVSDDSSQTHELCTLVELLPASVEELEVFCEGVELTEGDKALLDAPGTEHVKDITIYNCTRDKWISKRHRDHATSPAEANVLQSSLKRKRTSLS